MLNRQWTLDVGPFMGPTSGNSTRNSPKTCCKQGFLARPVEFLIGLQIVPMHVRALHDCFGAPNLHSCHKENSPNPLYLGIFRASGAEHADEHCHSRRLCLFSAATEVGSEMVFVRQLPEFMNFILAWKAILVARSKCGPFWALRK